MREGSGQIEAGGEVAVYDVASNEDLHLRFCPMVSGWQQKEDWTVVRNGSSLPLIGADGKGIDVKMDVTAEENVPGKSGPRTARLSVPCWIVNNSPYVTLHSHPKTKKHSTLNPSF